MTLRTFLVVASLAPSVAIGCTIAFFYQGDAARAAVGNERVGGPLIGLSLDTLKEERWQNDRDMFVRRATELGAEVRVQAANSSDVQQMEDVRSLLTLGIDVLVIVPHDGKAMAEAVALAHSKDVSVIAYDRLILDPTLDLYMSFDNVKVGEQQAQFLVDRFRPSPEQPRRLVRIYGSKADNNAHLFKEGQDNILNPLIRTAAVRVVHEDWAENWDPDKARQIMDVAIVDPRQVVDAVLASNDGTASGAIQAMANQGRGRVGKVVVTGQDAELAALQRIARGQQAMTIYKPLNKLAADAADAAVRMAEGRWVIAKQTVKVHKQEVPAILFKVVTVTKDHIEETVVKEGYQTREAIYGE